MKNFTVKAVEQYDAHLVLSLTPQSEKDILSFWPGQYAGISVKQGAKRTPMRCFSMTSSPHNTDVQFSMRISGMFTKKISKLQPGDEIGLEGPFGDFVLDPSDRAVVMLAAGIGITPYISMLRHAVETKSTLPITLLYANRSVHDIPFHDELLSLQAQNPNIRVIFAVDHAASDQSRGVYGGRIDSELVRRVTGGRLQPYTFFICGPKAFSKSMHSLLSKNNVRSSSIVTEAFSQSTGLRWSMRNLDIAPLTYLATAATLIIGIVGVMALDLIRYVPKAAAHNTASTAPDTYTSSASTTTSSAPTSSASNTSNTAQTTTTPSSTTSTAAPATNTYYYQPPTSSMS